MSNNTPDLFKKIKTTDYSFSGPVWNTTTREAKDFIDKLIEPNVKLRMTAEQALHHPWIAGINENDQVIDDSSAAVFVRLKNFQRPKKLQMELLKLLVSLLDEDYLLENKRAF